MTERQLQDAIVELARLLGWLVYHTHDSRHSAAGFPDLVLVRGVRIVFAELKSANGELAPAQIAWLEAFERVGDFIDLGHFSKVDFPTCGAPSVESLVWRPDDWTAGRVEEVLRAT